ncbi:condensation domain-containing protein [Gordonia zhaorongruii]|uniref:condensation domain-containing protein n=1 Tax=Gordonia zhaorongruii TaxID=2597659 RepID=UPI00104758E8|nr:condensation domain-containing protein [Gordonia zhaorongruii]
MNVLTDAQQEAMRRRLAAAGIDTAGTEAGSSADESAPQPQTADGALGIAERRMWKIYEIDPESDSHNFAVHLEFGAPYSIEDVVAATERLIASSQVIGSIIEVVDGVPRRRAIERNGRWAVPGEVWEWGEIPTDGADEARGRSAGDAVAQAAQTLAAAPFRLTEEPPCRVRVLRHHTGVSMILVLHHMAGDETILPPVIGALVSGDARSAVVLPTGAAVDPSTRTGAHADAAVRHAQRTWAAEGIRYPLSGQLPASSAEDSWFSVMGEGPGRCLSLPVPDAHVKRSVAFAREVGATPNALFIVISALTVSAMSGSDDFVMLVPADNRAPGETTDRVGYTGNIIPMRFTFDRRDRTGDALRSGVAAVYGAMEHSAIDYGTILTALRTDGGRFPVAEIMTLVKNAPLRGIAVPEGAHVTCETITKDVVHYPLSLAFEFSENDDLRLDVEYRTDILDEAFADRAARTAIDLIARLPQSADAVLGEVLGSD